MTGCWSLEEQLQFGRDYKYLLSSFRVARRGTFHFSFIFSQEDINLHSKRFKNFFFSKFTWVQFFLITLVHSPPPAFHTEKKFFFFFAVLQVLVNGYWLTVFVHCWEQKVPQRSKLAGVSLETQTSPPPLFQSAAAQWCQWTASHHC